MPISTASRMGIGRNTKATAEKAMTGRQPCGSQFMAGDHSMRLRPRHPSPNDYGMRHFDHAPAFAPLVYDTATRITPTMVSKVPTAVGQVIVSFKTTCAMGIIKSGVVAPKGTTVLTCPNCMARKYI